MHSDVYFYSLYVKDTIVNIDYVRFVPSTINTPNILYKYRDLNKNSLSSLICNQVYFSKPQDFNDPYEPEKIFEDSDFGRLLDKTVKESGILCLCSEPTSLSMWSYYASALKGFALGYSTTKLLESIAPKIWKEVYEVNYDRKDINAIETNQIIQCDFEKKDPEKIKMFATKAGIFAHEKEFRIVIEPHPNFDFYGYGLYDHASEAISEIIFGELISKHDEKTIREALKRRDINFKRAIRVKNEFKIEVENV
jgi:hypothetical protein